ncbi:thiamine diphosphokinase [Paenibacillus nanensis]|uniref:Thiamine diphosphokinase n=1 Tax=Paenibacillus nanensis TaxID=393251 RepID=A0A3A1V1E0_9BACL|nr:thiamine diphosphokinase [Paenibacillus nanensis]RIX53616.1 thiamine diphosphokinase [Paenibacillus nanensis]
MLQRIVIFAGGALGDWSLGLVRESDTLIGADSGARFLLQNGLAPDVAIGDFDSVSEEEMALIREKSGRTIACDPIDKDYTDTEMAFRLALDMKPSELLLIGALGTRFDHSLANVHLLALADAFGIPAQIIDAHNRIRLISRTCVLERVDHPQVSLLPLSEQVTGITLSGFQYPLNNATLTIGQSIGISNVLLAESGTIRLKEGRLLVIQSRD